MKTAKLVGLTMSPEIMVRATRVISNVPRMAAIREAGSGLYYLVDQDQRHRISHLLRLQFTGALYHLTARGNAHQKILGDIERGPLDGNLKKIMDRYKVKL